MMGDPGRLQSRPPSQSFAGFKMGGDFMDPGTIIAIVEATRKGLEILLKLKDAFHGEATSKRKLEALGSRLAIISRALDRTADIPDLLESHPYALDELRRTIEDCNKLLRGYEHALSDASHTKATYQRAKLALLDDDKLKELHDRLDRHVGDLSLWHVSEMNYASRRWDSVVEQPGLEPTLKPTPQKSSTLLTDASGATLCILDDEYQAQLGRSTAQWSPEPPLDHELTLGTSPGSSNIDPFDVAPGKNDTPFGQNNPWADDLLMSAGNPGLGRRQSSKDWVSTLALVQVNNNTTSSPPVLGLPASYAPSNASSRSNSSSPAGEVKLRTLRESFTFTADNYTVSLLDNARVVEWSGESFTIKHFVPLGNAGIPFTRPFDKRDDRKENQLRFMPPEMPHRLQIITHQQGRELQRDGILGHYVFSSRRERQKFQEDIRGACKMVSFRGISITTSQKQKTPIARDVNIKIWTFQGKRSTISFARNLDNQKHEEICLNCFEDYKTANKDSQTVTLRVRKPEGTPEPSASRRHSFRLSVKPKAENVESFAASRRSSTNSLGSIEGGEPPVPLPDSLRKIEWLRLGFEDKRGIRGDFCRFWAEAYYRNPLNPPRRDSSPAASRQSTSPGLHPQTGPLTGSLSSSPMMLSNQFPHTSPRLLARSTSWGQHLPSVHGEWFLGEPVIQEETSQGDGLMTSVAGTVGYDTSNR